MLVSLFPGRALKLPQCWNRDVYQAEEEPVKVTADGGLAAWAVGRRTHTGSVTPGRTRTRPTPPGDAAPTASNPTLRLHTWSGGSSPSG